MPSGSISLQAEDSQLRRCVEKMPRAKIVSLINYKGGVAKTTSTYHIGCSLAQHFNKKVFEVLLALRSAAAPGGASSGLQPSSQCLLKGGEQERQGGCAQAGRVAAQRNAATGLSRRKWTPDAA